MKLRIKKNDQVKVIAGVERGKSGRVLDVDRENLRVRVEGVNLRKKHSRASAQNPQGGVQEVECPIHYSNIMLMDENEKATRVGIEREKQKGVFEIKRIAKTSGKPVLEA